MSDALHLPITRCPHCRTAFRVREEQLTLRRGMVRCGACRGVFNAIQHLLHKQGDTITVMPVPGDLLPEGYVAAPSQLSPLTLIPDDVRAAAQPFTSAPSPPPTTAPTAPPTAAPTPAPTATPTAAPTPAPTPSPTMAPVLEVAREAVSPINRDRLEIPTGLAPARHADRDEERLSNTVRPNQTSRTSRNEFAERELATDVLEAKLAGEDRPTDATERFEYRWKPKRAKDSAWLSALWGLAALLLVALFAGQATMIFRNDLAVRFPALRQPLTQLCDHIGCTVAAPERPSHIVIDGAELSPDPAHAGLYTFSATLRNKHEHATAFPHLVITLSSINNEIVARRIFTPNEFVPGVAGVKNGLAGNSEIEFKLWLDASTIRPEPAGFDVRTTYAVPGS